MTQGNTGARSGGMEEEKMTTTYAYEAGRRAFIPGWTNHVEHNPYAKGSQDYADFANGWDRESSTSEHGLEVE